MTVYETAFADFPMPERQLKPRTRGLSMMIDWGMGLQRQADVLESTSQWIDFAKIAAGIARFMPRGVLADKLDNYRTHGISTSPGGLFAEVAMKLQRFEDYVARATDVGFTGIEISDNLLEMTLAEKAAAIRHAKTQGLKVFGEVGRKDSVQDDASFLADVANCLDAGADWVFLEASELYVDGVIRQDLIAQLSARFPAEKLIYELPVVIIPGISRDFKHQTATWLVRELGTEVNLANLEWDEMYITELVRRGFAGDKSHPQGVYRMAGF
ncbi:Phosphosulfolactate synthase [Bordetella ansorpii]|uniref:Phosphosulfolactate synthase n=1 Tax=Bordetella ansorpii TaxID=288768 RepID=A0A157NNF9_9BORD|nr:phosphosulfolactate synthase [Bordetella ansorpii]SAI22219.1 Phosphosulfolactate synthase [Bordetella ansorpii]